MFESPAPARTLRSLFGALVFVLGAQSIRSLFGSITWYLRDTVGLGVTDLIPIAVAPFVLGLLLPVVSRWLPVRGTLWLGTWLLVIARLVNQVSNDPAIEFGSAAVATAAFVGMLPLLASMGRSAIVGGVLLGIAIDSAIKGMGLSLDVAYQSGIGPTAMVAALVVLTIYSLYASPPIERQGMSWGLGLSLLGLGPFLFFQFLILQNQGWTSEVANIGGPQAQLRIALLNVLTLVVVAWLGRNRFFAALGLISMVAVAVLAEGDALLFNFLSIIAIPGAGLVWASMVADPEDRGVAAQATYLVGGATLFVVLGLAYYVPLDQDLGYTQEQARLAAAALLAVLGTVGIIKLPATRPGVSQQAWAFAALATLLPLLGFFVAGQSVREVDLSDTTVRAMTYNIHSAYDTSGRFDIDAIAQVIDDTGATIIGLQEVPRGDLISGVTDELTLLQQRLGFEHVAFFGTTDPTWGNAILSRYPIVAVERAYLPQVGTPLRRGYVAADVRVGGRNLLFMDTHLQHVNDSAAHEIDPEADLYPVHHDQIAELVAHWGGRAPSILVGDFNARPDWRQITELIEAGWVDSWPEAGQGDGFTARSTNPQHRIDYVFHTPDLAAIDAGVIKSLASDHLPVVVDIEFVN